MTVCVRYPRGCNSVLMANMMDLLAVPFKHSNYVCTIDGGILKSANVYVLTKIDQQPSVALALVRRQRQNAGDIVVEE